MTANQKGDFNSATAEAIKAINGMQRSVVDAVLEYREQHGPIESIDELENVSGVGPATLAKLSDSFTVRSPQDCLDEDRLPAALASGVGQVVAEYVTDQSKDASRTAMNVMFAETVSDAVAAQAQFVRDSVARLHRFQYAVLQQTYSPLVMQADR